MIDFIALISFIVLFFAYMKIVSMVEKEGSASAVVVAFLAFISLAFSQTDRSYRQGYDWGHVLGVTETIARFEKEVPLTSVPVQGTKIFTATVRIKYVDGQLKDVVLIPRTTIEEK